jgi:DNA-binding CsgD family transcriptional regulator
MTLAPAELMWMASEAWITEREREVMELRYCKDLSCAAIGRLLGITESTVKNTVAHVKQKFRAYQWPAGSAADAARHLAEMDTEPVAGEALTEYAEGILEAVENRRAGKPGHATHLPAPVLRKKKRKRKGQDPDAPDLKAALPPPLPKGRMVLVRDVLLMVMQREQRM